MLPEADTEPPSNISPADNRFNAPLAPLIWGMILLSGAFTGSGETKSTPERMAEPGLTAITSLD